MEKEWKTENGLFTPGSFSVSWVFTPFAAFLLVGFNLLLYQVVGPPTECQGSNPPSEYHQELKTYLIFVVFFTQTKFLENKIFTEKTRKLRQNTQKIANFLRYYGKIHSILPIFRVKSVKIYTGQKKFTRALLVGS